MWVEYPTYCERCSLATKGIPWLHSMFPSTQILLSLTVTLSAVRFWVWKSRKSDLILHLIECMTDLLLNLIPFEDFKQLVSNVLSTVATINFGESQELRAELVLSVNPMAGGSQVQSHYLGSPCIKSKRNLAWCILKTSSTELPAAQKFKHLSQAPCKDLPQFQELNLRCNWWLKFGVECPNPWSCFSDKSTFHGMSHDLQFWVTGTEI